MIETNFKKGAKFTFGLQNKEPTRKDGEKQTIGIVKYPNKICTIKILPSYAKKKFVPGKTISYEWLPWLKGETSMLVLDKNVVITGPMSGCIIPVWKDKRQFVVGHVGTTDVKKQSTKAKENFLSQMPGTAKGFNPAKEWIYRDHQSLMEAHKGYQRPSVFALVTRLGVCHTILAIKLEKYYLSGGIKKVPTMELKNLITKFAGIEKGRVKQLANKLNIIRVKKPY